MVVPLDGSHLVSLVAASAARHYPPLKNGARRLRPRLCHAGALLPSPVARVEPNAGAGVLRVSFSEVASYQVDRVDERTNGIELAFVAHVSHVIPSVGSR